MHQVQSKKTVREALDRAIELDADRDRACAAVAQSLALPVEAVREVANEEEEPAAC